MANSSKIDRAQQKSAGQRNRAKDVTMRAKKAANKHRTARARKARTVKPGSKPSSASS